MRTKGWLVTVTVEFMIVLIYESHAKEESREMQYPNLSGLQEGHWLSRVGWSVRASDSKYGYGYTTSSRLFEI